MVELTKEQVKSATASDWDTGNNILYDMCKQFPEHKNKQDIIAKVWLIGRAYAAAIERRRNKDNSNDDFYIETVAPKIKESKIDEWLEDLKKIEVVSESTLGNLLSVHYNVTNLFFKISGLKNRSLSSKYLHFHYPNLFFIYDKRAVSAISHLSNITGRVGRSKYENYDNEYRIFCEKCLKIRNYVKEKFNIQLTPRQLDNLLLQIKINS